MKTLDGIIGAVAAAGLVLSVFGCAKEPPESPENIPTEVADVLRNEMIVVTDPQPLTVITSPLTVRGEARGAWYFEADFQIILTDWDGRIIAENHASAIIDPNDPESTWMTDEFVPFTGTIEFENPSNDAEFSKRGTLIFQKSNPSGLPQHANALEIPVLFSE